MRSLTKYPGGASAIRTRYLSRTSLVLASPRLSVCQIIQQRATEVDYYESCRSLATYQSRNYRKGTPFSIPLLLSYLPHATTVGGFRDMVALCLRRHVLPRDPKHRVRHGVCACR